MASNTTAMQDFVTEEQFTQVSSFMFALASLFIFARVGVQIWQRRKPEPLDIFLYLAFAAYYTMMICYFLLIPKIYRIGRISTGREKAYPGLQKDIVKYVRLMLVSTFLFWSTLWSVKLSFLLLYKKLMEGLPIKYIRMWWTLVIFCSISLAGCFASYMLACPSFVQSLKSGQCLGPRSISGTFGSLYTSYTVDVLSDLLIMALPIKLVWNLQMPRAQKAAVLALFASGFVIITFATLRVVQIGARKNNTNNRMSATWLAMWTIIETSIAICVGCCPALASVWRRFHDTKVSYDSHGYVRHGEEQATHGWVHAEGVSMGNVSAGPRKQKRTVNMYSTDAGSSQEEFDGHGQNIKVTTTVDQNTTRKIARPKLRNGGRTPRGP